jgi:CheY-like chemotaxis protein
MSEAMNFSRPELNQEEFCLDDIFESLKKDREELERENLERADLSREASIAASSALQTSNYAESEASSANGASTTENSANDPNADPSQQDAATALRNEPRADRRRRRRALISAPVRVRGINVTDGGVDEVTTTIDVSRAGILFDSANPGYSRGMEVAVIFPFSTAPTALHAEQQGRIVRVIGTSDGRYAVAVALGEGVGEDIVDSCGRKLTGTPERISTLVVEPQVKRPLVLVVDSDEAVRCSLKSYLTGEGYDVMAANNAPDAREVLNMFTPALVIAEVEGDGLPGYDLCAHVKSSPRLKQVPVVLTTSSGYPSDYANAHSLGAVVCMTKPYKLERLGHVARLLAPPSLEFCSQKVSTAPRPADPSRRFGYVAATTAQPKSAQNGSRRFRFPSFR